MRGSDVDLVRRRRQCACVRAGQAKQVSFHLNKAMDSGLSKAQAFEMLTHLAFYAGWPKVFSAPRGRIKFQIQQRRVSNTW